MAAGETAPVGMTILLQGRTLFRCLCRGHYRIVIPTGAKRSGGTCCFSHPTHNSNLSHPSPLVIPTEAKWRQSAVRPAALSNPSRKISVDAGSRHSFGQQNQPHRIQQPANLGYFQPSLRDPR